jgi:hypothetical protein
MRKLTIIAIALIVSLTLAYSVHAKRRRSDRGIPIVPKLVCSDLCREPVHETIYIYEGIIDPSLCEEIGGQMYSHQGWELITVCKVMNKHRCRQQDGKMKEFHFPFLPKNYVHLGCTPEMKPNQCRKLLRDVYADKTTPNKYFMNNLGCLVH